MADQSAVAGGDVFSQRTDTFLEWFTSANGTRLSPKVQLKDLRADHAGRGAVAAANIEEDEELFAIPRSLVLTTTTSTIPPEILEPLKDSGSWPPLIVTIVYEYLQRENSAWYPYFQVLPQTFDSLMFWKPAEVDQLQASAVVGKIGRQQAEKEWRETIIPIMGDHPELFPLNGEVHAGPARSINHVIPGFANTEQLVELAHMAGSLIMAYAFDIDRDGQKSDGGGNDSDEFEEDDEEEPLKGMVPFADMLNADADRNNARLFQEDDYLVMKATKPILSGEQIFNDYGPLPRSDLLRMYGYVTENYAKHDVLEVSHESLVQVAGKKHGAPDQSWLKKEAQLDELGVIDDGYTLPRPSPDTAKLEDALPGDIHMLLRALCTDNFVGRRPKDAVTIQEAALLQSALTKRLSEYATSLETDEATLAAMCSDPAYKPNIDPHCAKHRFSMALQVRIGEKDIIHQFLRLCQSHIAALTDEVANKSTKRQRDDGDTSMSKAARKNKR